MSVSTRIRLIEDALIVGLREQGADIEQEAGSTIAKLVGGEMLPNGLWLLVNIDVSRLAQDMERAML